MKTLFYDTETTGIPVFEKPSDDACQPHITQISGKMVDDERKTIQDFNFYIKPEGWTVPLDVVELTKTTQADLEEHGWPIAEVMRGFMDMAAQADLLVGHNESFDRRMVRIELKRLGGTDEADDWKARKGYCTCKESRAIVSKAKAPTLAEAYSYFFGPCDWPAHNSLTDMIATEAVYWALVDKKGRFDKYASLRVSA